MTFHTKAATDEIYEMFNQPLKDEDEDSDSSDDTDDSSGSNDNDDISLHDYSYEEGPGESGMNDITQTTGQLSVNPQQTSHPVSPPFTPVREPEQDARKLPTMTPITETGETPLNKSSPIVSTKDVINPMDFSVRQNLLLSPSNRRFLENQQNFFSYGMKFEMEQKLKRALQPNRNQGNADSVMTFPKGNQSISFLKIIGEGGFGSVFLVKTQLGILKACKVERTRLPWEYYMLKKVEERLQNTRALTSMMTIDEVHSFEDEQYLFQQFLPYGTMLDAVNYWKEEQEGRSFEEVTVMYFAVEILRAIETLHSGNIIHGDIKPDNFMIRFDSSEILQTKNYQKSGEAGWHSRGIKIIDFGRGIDVKLFPPQVQFTADWKMDQQDCVEMQQEQTWTYQADYHGIAAIIYLMLFGDFIKLAEDREGEVSIFRIANSLKRYWQKDMWNELFTVLLNSALVAKQSGVSLPLTPLLSNCREKFEEYLEEHTKSNSCLYESLTWLQEGLTKRFSQISKEYL
jgi:checkpoint serine/threonine-protein kinase